MARLEIRKLKRVSRVEVGDGAITIGRSSRNSVMLRDESISREHCVIEDIDGDIRVRDLKSRTGTHVNGRRIEQATLHHRDRIAIGPFVIVFRDPERAVSPASQEPDQNIAELESAVAAQNEQIAKLNADLAVFQRESAERSKEIESLIIQHERLVQSQRNSEATRQTAVQKIERLEQRIVALNTQFSTMRNAAANLAALQHELAEAEQAWADVDERIQSIGNDVYLLRERESLSARLDVLHLQRDELISEMTRMAAQSPAAL